ncbi:MAG TPA: hypothetical protein VFB34_00305 [Chloroflexota bacterium]|nr:hypothetical protein [Chloroflexota bacterium]
MGINGATGSQNDTAGPTWNTSWQWEVGGTGAMIDGSADTSDALWYVTRSVGGDATLESRIVAPAPNVTDAFQGGLMIRQDPTDASSPFFAVYGDACVNGHYGCTYTGGLSVAYRSTEGGDVQWAIQNGGNLYGEGTTVKIYRHGNDFTAYEYEDNGGGGTAVGHNAEEFGGFEEGGFAPAAPVDVEFVP